MTSYNELKNNILEYAYEQKIPVSGEFELTSACNFACEMCYAKGNDKSLSKENWIKIFDMAQSAGLLYALLTGGEIFSHPDFIFLYEYLYDLGVKITLYTNGSLLSLEILECLKKRPPEMVAITLYGYDEESYQAFTKVNSFKMVDKTIDLLKKAKINLALRTIPLPLIYQNLDNIIAYAKSKNLKLGYFLYVSKFKNDDLSRLTAKELLDFEKRIKEAFKFKPSSHKSKCGAFRNGYFINHKGYMQGCPMMANPTEKVEDDLLLTFLHLQEEWMKLLEMSPCKSCELNNSCMTCLARRHLEGNVFKCSSYLKEIAEEKENA